MPQTLNDVIKGRVQTAFTEYEPQARRYRASVQQFRDPTIGERDDAVDMADVESQAGDDSLPVGTVAHMRTNIQTKVDTITIGDPDFHLTMKPEASDLTELAREGLKALWQHCGLTDLNKKVILNRHMGPMGIACYAYDQAWGPVFQLVKPPDFGPDPHVTDWNRLRFASRKIRMPRDDARDRYPAYADLFGQANANSGNGDADARKESAVELTLYWDADTEAVLYQGKVIDRGENPYGKVPFLFLHGDPDPASTHDTGDFDNAGGLQEALVLMQTALNNHALHGGPLNLWNSAMFDRKGAAGLQKGRQQGWLDVKGGNWDKALKRFPGEEPSAALLQAYELIERGLDEAQAVSPSQRGAINTGARFATEVQASANLAGARGLKERNAYEQFCAAQMRIVIDLVLRFETPKDDMQALMLEALSGIAGLQIVESSTAYKDPAAMRQDAVMLFNIGMQARTAGVPVDLVLLFLDVLRAFEKRDVQKYIVSAPMGAPLLPGAPNAAAGAPAASQPPAPPGAAPITAPGAGNPPSAGPIAG